MISTSIEALLKRYVKQTLRPALHADLSTDRNCQFSKQVLNFTSHKKERKHILRGQRSLTLWDKNCMRVKTASTFIYIVWWLGEGRRAVRVLFPGCILLLSVAHRPSVSTLVAQPDPKRPILEEFNFGNRPVTYASLKTENMFFYGGCSAE